MKKLLFLLMITFTLVQCNILEKDTLPEPGEDTENANMIFVLKDGAGLINVPGLLSSDIASNDVELITKPQFGKISVINDKYLKYTPTTSQANYEEKIVLKKPGSNGDGVSVTVVVRSNPDDFCEVEAFKPTYLGTPLKYSIKKGTDFTFNLIDLFCNYENGGNGGVVVSAHPELNGVGFDISITSGQALMSFTPEPDFIGVQGVVYELCYDLEDLECLLNEQFHDCPSYPQSCKYFLYTYVEIDVTE